MDVLDVVLRCEPGHAAEQLAQRVHHPHDERLGELALVLVDGAVLVVEVAEVLPHVGGRLLGPDRRPGDQRTGDGQGDGEGDAE